MDELRSPTAIFRLNLSQLYSDLDSGISRFPFCQKRLIHHNCMVFCNKFIIYKLFLKIIHFPKNPIMSYITPEKLMCYGLSFLIVFFVPKRYPRVISVLVILFTVTVFIIMDHTIASPPLNLYDINDRKEYDMTDIITYFMYAPYALLIVYVYDKFSPTGLYFTAHIIMCSLLSLGFERLAVILNVFKYNGWTLLYSY